MHFWDFLYLFGVFGLFFQNSGAVAFAGLSLIDNLGEYPVASR